MGGVIRAPKPMVVEPPAAAPVQTATTVAEVEARNAAAAEDAGREAGIRAVARARRGLAGTIRTGARGVLDPLPLAGARKTLLGE